MNATSLQLDQRWQLFLDDHAILRSTGLTRVLHHPRPRGVVIPADKPWETAGCEMLYGSSIIRRQDGSFCAFYRAMWWDSTGADLMPTGKLDRAHHAKQSVGYATSGDGIHWEKPELNLATSPAETRYAPGAGPWPSPVGSTMQNNIGVPFIDLRDMGQYGNVSDPARRYALRVIPDANDPASRGIIDGGSPAWPCAFAAEIPDFLHDSRWREKLTIIDGQFNPRRHYIDFWDEQHHEWVALDQGVTGHWLPSREIARFFSKDLKTWRAEAVLYPDSEDAHTAECYDEPMTLHAFASDGVVIGLLSWFRSERVDLEGGPRNDLPPEKIHPWHWYRKGPHDIRVVLSRDGGKTWDRTVSRQPWIAHSSDEHAYDRMAYRPSPPVRVGDEDWFYVTVGDGDHLVIRNREDQATYYHDRVMKMQIALYTQKRNRYVSMRAGSRVPEVLITKPLVFDEDNLHLNVDASHGSCRVAIAPADEQVFNLRGTEVRAYAPHMAKPLPGLSFEDCQVIRQNEVDHTVRFKTVDNVRERLGGRPVFVLIELHDADVFGFRGGE